MRDRWRMLGIAHFLALSGLHLGIVALAVYRILSLLQLRGLVRESVAFLVFALYASAAGAPLSLLRAGALLLVVRGHLLIGRRVHPDEAVLIGAFIVCLVLPGSMTDPGFMLSVCAAGGVLLVGLPIGRLVALRGGGPMRRTAGYLAAALCVSMSATIFTIPLATRFFGRAPLSGVLLSVLLAPLVSVFLYAAFVYVAAGGAIGSVGAAVLNRLAWILSSLPGLFPVRFSAAVIRGDMNEILFAAGAALLAFASARGKPKRATASFGAAAIACSFLLAPDAELGYDRSGCDTLCTGAALAGRGGTLLVEGTLYRERATVLARRLLERGIGEVDRAVMTSAGCRSLEGLSALDELIEMRVIVVSPWLLECPDAMRLRLRAKIEGLSGTIFIGTHGGGFSVRGPRSAPGTGGAVALDDADLRIYPLDSGGR